MKLTLMETQFWGVDSAVNSILGAKNIDQVMNISLQKVSRELGALAGVMLMFADASPDIQVKVFSEGRFWVEESFKPDKKITKKVLQARVPLVCEHVEDASPVLGVKLSWQPGSALYIPLMAGDKVLGVMGLVSPIPKFFKKRCMPWFSLWGKQLGLAIYKLKSEWNLNRSEQILAALSEITNILGYPLEFDATLQLVLDKILGLFELETGAIYLLDDGGEKLKLSAAKGLPDILQKLIEQETEQSRFRDQILQADSAVAVTDLSQLSQTDNIFRQSGYRSFVGIPIKGRKRTLGVISLLSKEKLGKLSPLERDFLCSTGNGIAANIEVDILFKQLIHAKKEWEETFDSITDMVVILDQDFNILRANKAMANKFKKHPREIAGKKCFQFLHAGIAHHPDCPCVKTMKSGKPCTKEIKTPNLRGTYLISTSSVHNGEKRVNRFACIIRDITAHKILEHQLLQMQKMECIGTLAGGLAHDFNNLLEGILSYAYFIKQNLSVEDAMYKEVEAIENIANKGANLIYQLMDFARRGEVTLKPVNLNNMVDEITRLLSRTINKNIRINKSLNKNLLPIRGDDGQIQQLILNVCLNARDAMPEGGEIKINTRKVFLDEEISEINPWAESGDYICLSIADTGCGMDSQTQEKIFEPFFTTKQNSNGTGLGLASVYRIMKNHRAHIKVKSKLGQGSTIEVYLPILKKKPGKITRKSETILVVDNEGIVCQRAQKILMKRGYKVLLAADAQTAVDTLKQAGEGIDLVILDMVVPMVNGEQTYTLLKRIKSDIRVLLSSQQQLSEHTKRALSRGTAGILQKPYQPSELLQQVEQALDNRDTPPDPFINSD